MLGNSFSKLQGTNTLQSTSWNIKYRKSELSKKPVASWIGQNLGEHQMINKKIPDRRITRTRKSLQDALAELILEKGFHNITVQDVLDRANVGRSTFYYHFQNIDDMLLSQFDDVRMQFGKFVETEGIVAENS
jgi:tetracycline repressor-like protein